MEEHDDPDGEADGREGGPVLRRGVAAAAAPPGRRRRRAPGAAAGGWGLREPARRPRRRRRPPRRHRADGHLARPRRPQEAPAPVAGHRPGADDGVPPDADEARLGEEARPRQRRPRLGLEGDQARPDVPAARPAAPPRVVGPGGVLPPADAGAAPGATGSALPEGVRPPRRGHSGEAHLDRQPVGGRRLPRPHLHSRDAPPPPGRDSSGGGGRATKRPAGELSRVAPPELPPWPARGGDRRGFLAAN